MSVTSMPISRLVPLVTTVIVVCALAVGGVAIWQTRSALAAEKTLNSYLAVKEKIERFALLDIQVKYNGVVITAYPATKDQQTGLITTDTAEMGEIIK